MEHFYFKMLWPRHCICAVVLLIYITSCSGQDDVQLLKQEIQNLGNEFQSATNRHSLEMAKLRKEMEQLREEMISTASGNQQRNEQVALEWAKSSIEELRGQLREIWAAVNATVWLKQHQALQNEIQRALAETAGLARLVENNDARLDKHGGQINQHHHQLKELKTTAQDLGSALLKLKKEFKTAKLDLEQLQDSRDTHQPIFQDHNRIQQSNEIYPDHKPKRIHYAPGKLSTTGGHKYRHLRMLQHQLAEMTSNFEKFEDSQASLQLQMLDVQEKLARCEEQPNWNLVAAKVDLLELENKIQRDQIANLTLELSDFDKLHVSMLELLENVQNVENKVDKTLPDFRKEISKLDVNIAQVNSQSSYLREDQENIRQTVKAIAVGVSNAIDKADVDRKVLRHVNVSVTALEQLAKQHSYRLYDHIMKSEANRTEDASETIIPLPELMGEVKDLEPVQKEFEELVSKLPHDCSTVSGPPGQYLIAPGGKPLDTWCNNGSTLLQRRINGSIEFNVKFSEYAAGFGIPEGEYWLGLDTMHRLTADNCSSMQIDMKDIYGGGLYAHYDLFSVGPADSGYKLFVSGFSGNASDAFDYQNRMEFSAIDLDRDISNTHCAGNYEGGWWFSHCQHVNINGKYSLGLTWFDSVRNEWVAVATSEMRLYRRADCA